MTNAINAGISFTSECIRSLEANPGRIVSTKGANTAQELAKLNANKEAARHCLMAADRFLKDSEFQKARTELDKALKLDPSNGYIFAFQDRINYFEELRKKEPHSTHGAKAPAPKKDGPESIKKAEKAVQEGDPKHKPEEVKQQAAAPPSVAGDGLRKEEQRQREEESQSQAMEDQVTAEAKRKLDIAERAAADERKRKETVAQEAIEEQRRRELDARAVEEQRKKEQDTRLADEDARRREEEHRLAEVGRRREREERALDEEHRRRELEMRASAEEQKRRELETRVAAEEQRRRELEVRLAAEEQRRKEEEQRAAEERRRKELEERTAAEVMRLKEAELRATEEQRMRRELEFRVAAEEKRSQQLEQRAEDELKKRVEVEVLAKEEERRKLDEMRRQIEALTAALEQEKKAREEITTRNLQTSVKQLRTTMEAAWVNGAPTDEVALSIQELSVSLSLSEEVVQSVQREVKLEMYSRAVKEVIAKRKLLRNSSSTLEWLRKVYQVSVAEYLENESKFLLDLVANQYKGTILLISKTIGSKEDITSRLKSTGYAVVQATSPEVALEKIEKVNPNLILTDTEFPSGLSGVRFMHILRANSKFNFIPFILIADKGEVVSMSAADLKPNEACLTRPLDYEELTNVINEKLNRFREYISSLA